MVPMILEVARESHVDVWTTLGRHSLKIIINNIIIN
jgi:hypothetical protein